ncbi:uncharacterized protein LOC106421439 [Brassica napus]|uniref:uncharacterized protein LOC106421439 n=1 Tax=Brassica napus TaxID=3708 RepID=UPI0006AA99E6|nr:uncharacterized protein LOC106421439 [Brassica napus]
MRNVPYLLFNNESLSRITTAVGKPDSLAPETERKKNFEVAKLYVRVDLTAPLPHKIISGFSNGREVQIEVSYPWLPVKCDTCMRFGHKTDRCPAGVFEGSFGQVKNNNSDINGAAAVAPASEPVTEMEETTTTEPLQDGEVAVLEEGETAAATRVDVPDQNPEAVQQDHPTSNAIISDEMLSLSSDTAVTVNGAKVPQSPDDGFNTALPGVVYESLISPDPTNVSKVYDSVPDTGTSVEDTNQRLPADPGIKQEHNDYPAEDRDNPFLLVNNRKCGRKASFWSFLETHILESNKERVLGAIPRGWNYFSNFEANDSGRIVVVWDPTVTLLIYNATAQSVTCGITILSQNITLTVTFVYWFNLVEDRRSLWTNLADHHDSTPVSNHPWCVLGDFNQMLRSSHHSNHLSSVIDDSGMDEANLGMQDAQLFEAQAKGLVFFFPDSFADYLDPSQSDHTPCLFRMPAIRRQVIKQFKFFHHVIDHPEYAETVGEAWNCGQITGTDLFKLVRSLKLLKRPLRRLNKRHFSGITQRVKAQRDRVDELQRRLLTSPDTSTAREEHLEHDKLNTLLKAEEKYYKQRSRVRWAEVGDRWQCNLLYAVDDIKAHAADYFQGILGSTDLPVSSAMTEELRNLLPFQCSDLQQDYLKRPVTAAEIKVTLFTMPLNKSPGPDGYSVEFIRASWDTVGEDIINAVSEFFRNGRLLKDMNTTAIALIPKKPQACSLGDYRPISCCNIVYKLISKIVANRLKPILSKCVSPNQAAFLKGRSLGENVILATEQIKDYNKSTCHKSAMLKIDLRKAFDTACWDFVIKVLEAQQFPAMFITWITE